MTLSAAENGQLLLAVILLLASAHAFGYLFARVRQPRVIGEIVGGLMLGPTVLGAWAPDVQRQIFHDGRVTPPVLAAIVQFGLQLLMFTSGVDFRATFERGERRTALGVSAVGTLVPFLAGLAFVRAIDARAIMGSAQHDAALMIVVAIGLAVTSIPVVSRIMMDLDLLATSFARIVLAAAVLEDLALYVALAVALGLVDVHGALAPVPALLGLAQQPAPWRHAYSVLASVLFFALALTVGPRAFRGVGGSRFNVIRRASPIGAMVLFMLVMTALAIAIGVASMFGAFLAGVIVGVGGATSDAALAEETARARDAVKSFAVAFFVPLYFASVGLRLDLLHAFDARFFVLFTAFACLVKATSVYAGARLSGETAHGAKNLAVVMNARGGPGIVVASVALDAHIIHERLYATLVLLALVTSSLAGTWLARATRRGEPLR